jgi:phenylalanyl-tRNA synthetase beta chain
MRISKKWLERFMDLQGRSMEEVADAITQAGFEVEGIEPVSSGTNLVIGEVLTCKDHPDSDHLHVTTVNTGEEELQIVCGAPNIKAGQKVIVAKPGARLPGGEIKEGNIRGQKSQGMICALFELGVDKHLLRQDQIDGIEILDENAPVGNTDPLGYLGLDDVVLDVSLTPNRADCLSAFNMAKEIGAILNLEVTLPDDAGAADYADVKETELKISSETKNCPHFLGKIIGSVTIKPSIPWMKELLRASGMHAINNVVDISNIVMLETGQPMHFYDLKAIPAKEITVKDGITEDYTALDGVTYKLQENDTVITSEGKPIGIAGIMGGDDSKIEDDTTGLIIECAAFDHVAIRNTARRLNLNTESSQRYQKGIEPLAAKKAIDRAVALLKEYADAKDIEPTVEFGSDGYHPRTITCTLKQINERLGTEFTSEEVLDVFERLGFAPREYKEIYTVHVPSSRTDLDGMADLSEEVIRMLGYDRLPSTLPLMEMTEGKLNPQQRFRRLVRTELLENGLQDAITYTLVSSAKNEDAVLSAGEAFELPTPLSEERRFIRTSILPSLLEAAAYNINRGQKDISLFEISSVSAKDAFTEHLAIVLSGNLSRTRWLHEEIPADFYTLKGILESLLERAGVASTRVKFVANKKDTAHFHPGRSAVIEIDKKPVGIFGEIHPSFAKRSGLKQAVMAEIDLGKLLAIKKAKVKYVPVSRFPAVSRDLAFVVDQDMPAAKIIDVIKKNGKLKKEFIVKDVDVFDVYQGEHMEPGKKSIALNMTFQSDLQTLNDKEITEVFNNIIDAIVKQCSAQLRSA